MKILLIHGFRAKRSGEMHPDLKLRLDKALVLDKAEKFDAIVVSGGVTRRGVISDAAQSQNYLKDKTTTPIILEDRPHSTSEEVRFIKEKLSGNVLDKVVVIVSRPYLKRTQYLYSVLWPELKSVSFAPSESGVSKLAPVRELVYRFYAWLDPWEKFTPVKIFKRFLRQ